MWLFWTPASTSTLGFTSYWTLCTSEFRFTFQIQLLLSSIVILNSNYCLWSSAGQSTQKMSFIIHCYYLKQGRFTSTPIPDRSTLIGVCGEIIGHQHPNNLCPLLQELTFLFTRGTRLQQSTTTEKTDSTTCQKHLILHHLESESGLNGCQLLKTKRLARSRQVVPIFF